MKLSFTSAFLCTLATSFQKKALAQGPQFGDLPPTIGQHGNTEAGRQLAWEEFVKEIFPTWCVDANGERIDEGSKLCADGSPNGRWTPFYLTKWHGGEDPVSLSAVPISLFWLNYCMDAFRLLRPVESNLTCIDDFCSCTPSPLFTGLGRISDR